MGKEEKKKKQKTHLLRLKVNRMNTVNVITNQSIGLMKMSIEENKFRQKPFKLSRMIWFLFLCVPANFVAQIQ